MNIKGKVIWGIILLAFLTIPLKEVWGYCSGNAPLQPNGPTSTPGMKLTCDPSEKDCANELAKLCKTAPCNCWVGNPICTLVKIGEENTGQQTYQEQWTCPGTNNSHNTTDTTNFKGTASYTFETGIPGIAKKGETLPTTGISNLVSKIINFVFAIAGLLAFAMVIYAGVQYSVSAGNVNQQKDAKDRILWAIVGLVFLFTSYILLYTINPELVKIKEPNPQIVAGLGGDGGQIFNIPHGPIPIADLPQSIDQKYLNSADSFTRNLAKAINESLKNPTYYNEVYVCNTWVIAMYKKAGKSISGWATQLYYNAQPRTGEPQFGDLVFWCNPLNASQPNCYPAYSDNHIGIYVGKSEDGKMLVAQCGLEVSNNNCGSRCPCIMEVNNIPTYGGGYLTVNCCRYYP